MPDGGLFPGRHHTNFSVILRCGGAVTSAQTQKCSTKQGRNEDTHLMSSFSQNRYVDNLKTIGVAALNNMAEWSSTWIGLPRAAGAPVYASRFASPVTVMT